MPCEKCGLLRQKDSKQCAVCWGKEQSGKKNGNWKGGRRNHGGGYIQIKALWHPRSVKNDGYVFEHIIVMEKMIGRYLLPNENVHHKNSIRDDNRPENLELWARGQPNGARVADLYEWAIHIVDRYGDLFTPPTAD